MAKLVLSSGGTVVFQCFVDHERLAVGRDPTNQIVIDDQAVSREHAVILPVGNDHILEDLASANGTLVNGARVVRRILQHGDVIELGSFHLRYLNPKAATEMDLDRTMLITGLPDVRAELRISDESSPLRRTRASRTNFPKGHVHVTAGRREGSIIWLNHVIATFGKPGQQVAAITRRPHGYFLTHVVGRRYPRVNGQPLGSEPRMLRPGDVVQVADETFKFALD